MIIVHPLEGGCARKMRWYSAALLIRDAITIMSGVGGTWGAELRDTVIDRESAIWMRSVGMFASSAAYQPASLPSSNKMSADCK